MYVPSDSFGGVSPERKASDILRTFFTFVAARVVLAQLEGSGRGALGAYDSQAAGDLHHFLQNVPLKDGDAWLTQLMRKNSSLGLRLLEVRKAYCEEAFEWDQLQRVSVKDMQGANARIMRQFAAASLAASLAQAAAEEEVAAASAPASAAAAAAPATASAASESPEAPEASANRLDASSTASSIGSAAASGVVTPSAQPALESSSGSSAEATGPAATASSAGGAAGPGSDVAGSPGAPGSDGCLDGTGREVAPGDGGAASAQPPREEGGPTGVACGEDKV
ncbi:hypothetical protein HYH02_009738 [Chlamydomonas schloesseri]|uniref:Uncharacterized protein n=1 Tax=Chlamydomonas schloesseri TaxID=2026947 RepID=A0A835TBA4_9CHLO|nr:hypothetical protein HYH02_009738 [Chlamydomonas schloesseri]|eukprot:KAG2442254.1 hypothetical protein HYH02_009738 [Chlamydomonas schloesseri]